MLKLVNAEIGVDDVVRRGLKLLLDKGGASMNLSINMQE